MAVTPSRPNVVFFDLDSTLILQTEPSEATWRVACCLFEPELKPVPVERVVQAIMDRAGWYWSDPGRHKVGRSDLRAARRGIAVEAFRSVGLDDPALAEKVADVMSDRREGAMALIPGAVETLTCLRGLGTRLGLITNGDSKGQRYKIHTFGLEPYFDLIQIEGEAGLGKPEDGVYELALEKLGVSPAEAWMVGDDLVWDIQAAQKAGLHAIWVDYEKKGLPENSPILPDRIIHSLKELTPFKI